MGDFRVEQPNRSGRYKTWSITWNNPPVWADEELNIHPAFNADNVVRVVAGREAAPTTGTPHLQIAIGYKTGTTQGGIQQRWPGCHCEPARSVPRLFEYARKGGDYYAFPESDDLATGTKPVTGQGKRNDLLKSCELVKEGGIKRLIEVEPDQYVRYHRGFEQYARKLQKSRDGKPRVWWIHGPTGTGKTRFVGDTEGWDQDNVWVSGDDLKWFDGYCGQPVAVFDDFRGDMCKFRWLLRLLDRYPIRVQIKGSTVEWKPKRIYITSAVAPEEAYRDVGEKLDQLTRRIDRVINAEETDMNGLAMLNQGI